jgi:hypothetical protein
MYTVVHRREVLPIRAPTPAPIAVQPTTLPRPVLSSVRPTHHQP